MAVTSGRALSSGSAIAQEDKVVGKLQKSRVFGFAVLGFLCFCCALTLHVSVARNTPVTLLPGLFQVVRHESTSSQRVPLVLLPENASLRDDADCVDRQALFARDDLHFRNLTLKADVSCTQRLAEKFAGMSRIGKHFLESDTCATARWVEREADQLEQDLGSGRRVRCYAVPKGKIFKREHGGGLVVSFSHKIIYIPNMKVASQMFKGVMETRFGAEVINQNYLRKALTLHNHSLNDYFVFTFVRDPIKHFISAYSEVDRRLTKVWLRKPAYAPKGFIAIKRNASNEPARALAALEEVRSGVERGLTPSHMYSQFWKVNRCLTRNKMPLIMNFIGHIEDLVEEWKKVESHIGVEHEPLTFSHSGTHIYKKHAQSIELKINDPEHANVALVRKICEYYRLDYACFDYPFPAVCKTG